MGNIDFYTALLVGKQTELDVIKRYNNEYGVIHQEEVEYYPIPERLTQREGYKLTKTPDLYFSKLDKYFEVKNSSKMFKRLDMEWYYLMGLDSGKDVYIITRGTDGWVVMDVMYVCENILPNVEWRDEEPENRIHSKYILTEDYTELQSCFIPFSELFT